MTILGSLRSLTAASLLAGTASQDASCWSGPFNQQFCCDLRAGPRGHQQCWDPLHTYERCCPQEAPPAPVSPDPATQLPEAAPRDPTDTYADRNSPKHKTMVAHFDRLCGDGSFFTYEACCSEHLGPKGNLGCWDPTHDYDKCCRLSGADILAPPSPSQQAVSSTLASGDEVDPWSSVVEAFHGVATWASIQRAAATESVSESWNSVAAWISTQTGAASPEKWFEQACGGSGFTWAMCCSNDLGPRGNPTCWDRSHRHDGCCSGNAGNILKLAVVAAIFVVLAASSFFMGHKASRSPSSDEDAASAVKAPVTNSRDPAIDTAKYHLNTLMVWGHLLAHWSQLGVDLRLDGAEVSRMIFHWMNCFHTPTLVFLSGAVSQRLVAESSVGGLKTVFRHLCAFVLTSAATRFFLLAVDAYLPNSEADVAITWQRLLTEPWSRLWECDDNGGAWYLLAVVWWRAAAPTLMRLRWPVVFALLFVSLGVYDQSMQTKHVFAARDTFFYLPFFAAGLRLGPNFRGPSWIDQGLAQFLSLGWLAGAVPFLVWYMSRPDGGGEWTDILHGRWRMGMDGGGLAFDAARFAMSGLCVTSAVVLLRAVHEEAPVSSDRARCTLYTYVLHRPLLLGLGVRFSAKLYLFQYLTPVQAAAALLLVSVVANLALTSRAVTMIFGFIVEPRWLVSLFWSGVEVGAVAGVADASNATCNGISDAISNRVGTSATKASQKSQSKAQARNGERSKGT